MADFRTKDTEIAVTFAGEDMTGAMIEAAKRVIDEKYNVFNKEREKGNVCAKLTPKIDAEKIQKALMDYVYSRDGVRSIILIDE